MSGFIGEGVMERDAMLIGAPAQFFKASAGLQRCRLSRRHAAARISMVRR